MPEVQTASSPENDIHVLIVDDDTRLRQLLSSFLSINGYRTSVAADTEEADTILSQGGVSLVVLDVMMPGEDGIQYTKRLREASRIPVLILSAQDQVDDRIKGLAEGADDYLGKPFEPKELLLRIQAVLRRNPDERKAGSVGARSRVTFGGYNFVADRRILLREDETISLTASEAVLLQILANRPGLIFSREKLAEEAGGLRLRSVDVQVARLRRKLEQDPHDPRVLQTIRGQGYVLWPDRQT